MHDRTITPDPSSTADAAGVSASCEHPPERLYTWYAAEYAAEPDGACVLCVACCACGGVLRGAGE